MGEPVQEYFRREMNQCYRTSILYAKIVAMNSCFRYRNKNSMRKKVSRTNPAVVWIAAELANNSAVDLVIPAIGKSARCLKPFAPDVARKRWFRLSPLVKDRFIAGIVSKPNAIVKA